MRVLVKGTGAQRVCYACGHDDAVSFSRGGYRHHESTQQEECVESLSGVAFASTFPGKCRHADGCMRPPCSPEHARSSEQVGCDLDTFRRACGLRCQVEAEATCVWRSRSAACEQQRHNLAQEGDDGFKDDQRTVVIEVETEAEPVLLQYIDHTNDVVKAQPDSGKGLLEPTHMTHVAPPLHIAGVMSVDVTPSSRADNDRTTIAVEVRKTRRKVLSSDNEEATYVCNFETQVVVGIDVRPRRQFGLARYPRGDDQEVLPPEARAPQMVLGWHPRFS